MCLILSIAFRTKHVLRTCDKVVFILYCSGFSILAPEDSNQCCQNTGSSAIETNLRNLVPATQTLEPAKRCPLSPKPPFCFYDCF